MDAIILILKIVIGTLLGTEVLIMLGYLLTVIYEATLKSSDIKTAEQMAEGEVFDKKNKALTEACGYVEDIFKWIENGGEKSFRYKTGYILDKRLDATAEVLKRNGITRSLRFVSMKIKQTDSGKNCRKWDQFGKEWMGFEIHGAVIEEYKKRSNGEVVFHKYYPRVDLFFSLSRRLQTKEKNKSHEKDKWGRKIDKKDEYYSDKKLKYCPSCGAELPQNLKDATCPFCESTIFSDYYDWQVESLEIVPFKRKVRGTIWWIIYAFNKRKTGQLVINKIKEKIVRFSENDFRQDMYESCLDEAGTGETIDMFFGPVKVTSVKNTDTDTIIETKFPVTSISIINVSSALQVVTDTKNVSRTYKRVRYPDRFHKDDAVISAEKKCPSCGGAFAPDDNGNCTYCGTYLFRDNVKWIQVHTDHLAK